MALILLSVLGYFVLVWAMVGRDPPRAPVVVQYEPPEGFSPAAVGYLHRRGADPRQFPATILSLSRQGVLEIEETRRRWTVRRIGAIPESLSPEERAFAEALLPDTDALVITGISRRRIWEAKKALHNELRRRFQGRYFVANRRWFLLGLLLSLAAAAVLVGRTPGMRENVVGQIAVLLVVGVLAGRLIARGFRSWRIELAEMTPKPSLLAASIFPLLAAGVLAVLGGLAYDLYLDVPPALLVSALVLCVINAVFYQLFERPTPAGMEAIGHVEGFKRFLSSTEADRIARLSSRESEELFERLLPYAVALGLKNRWATLFGYAVDPVLGGGGGHGG